MRVIKAWWQRQDSILDGQTPEAMIPTPSLHSCLQDVVIPLPQAWCSLSLEDGRPGLGVDRAMRPLPRSYPSHCPLCLPQSHRTTPSDWPQELLSLPLQAGACCRLLLPALKPLGILCSNRSWGKPDCGRLLTCLCWAPVTFPKPTGSAGPTDGGCSHPW